MWRCSWGFLCFLVGLRRRREVVAADGGAMRKLRKGVVYDVRYPFQLFNIVCWKTDIRKRRWRRQWLKGKSRSGGTRRRGVGVAYSPVLCISNFGFGFHFFPHLRHLCFLVVLSVVTKVEEVVHREPLATKVSSFRRPASLLAQRPLVLLPLMLMLLLLTRGQTALRPQATLQRFLHPRLVFYLCAAGVDQRRNKRRRLKRAKKDRERGRRRVEEERGQSGGRRRRDRGGDEGLVEH